MCIDAQFVSRAEEIFINPSPTYDWNQIVNGVHVARRDGSRKTMAAVSTNTFRGFHRIDQTRPGASAVFKGFMVDSKEELLGRLKTIKSRKELDKLKDGLVMNVRERLTNVIPHMLESYNKLRKPIDLYVEHLVAMSTELNSERARLVPLLHLPLDSQMFDQTAIFSDAELRKAGVGRGDGYAAVTTKARYDGLQAVTVRRAKEISKATGRAFHPVYFDLIWNHRYAAWGGNLFEVNP